MSKRKKLRRIELEKVERRKNIIEQKRNKTKKIMAISVVFIIVIGLGIYFMMYSDGNIDIKDVESDPESIIQTATQIKIPTSGINGDASFYSYDSNGVKIKYFTVIGTDGNVHVAFDACDVCYGAKKGYRQIDEVMHCINCGREFAINSIGTQNTAGGCWPSYISKTFEEDLVVINIDELEAKRYMFA